MLPCHTPTRNPILIIHLILSERTPMLHKFYEWYCIVVIINIYLHYQTVHICQRVRFLLSLFYTDKFCRKNFTIDMSRVLFLSWMPLQFCPHLSIRFTLCIFHSLIMYAKYLGGSPCFSRPKSHTTKLSQI